MRSAVLLAVRMDRTIVAVDTAPVLFILAHLRDFVHRLLSLHAELEEALGSVPQLFHIVTCVKLTGDLLILKGLCQ